eukprot:TRINITY_DN4581_c0_g2_i1.p1 TRINITY_DN4581_c0_g2~~TRINITY_DN4581_c0_g2_i1.p1  ORF type:complete len:480 (-),score=104.46 TRINITY_DN4581_c0_g2_i1:698-1951(-)
MSENTVSAMNDMRETLHDHIAELRSDVDNVRSALSAETMALQEQMSADRNSLERQIRDMSSAMRDMREQQTQMMELMTRQAERHAEQFKQITESMDQIKVFITRRSPSLQQIGVSTLVTPATPPASYFKSILDRDIELSVPEVSISQPPSESPPKPAQSADQELPVIAIPVPLPTAPMNSASPSRESANSSPSAVSVTSAPLAWPAFQQRNRSNSLDVSSISSMRLPGGRSVSPMLLQSGGVQLPERADNDTPISPIEVVPRQTLARMTSPPAGTHFRGLPPMSPTSATYSAPSPLAVHSSFNKDSIKDSDSPAPARELTVTERIKQDAMLAQDFIRKWRKRRPRISPVQLAPEAQARCIQNLAEAIANHQEGLNFIAYTTIATSDDIEEAIRYVLVFFFCRPPSVRVRRSDEHGFV